MSNLDYKFGLSKTIGYNLGMLSTQSGHTDKTNALGERSCMQPTKVITNKSWPNFGYILVMTNIMTKNLFAVYDKLVAFGALLGTSRQ